MDTHSGTGADDGGARAYLTTSQVSEMLQVSSKTIYRWALSDPTFPALKIAGIVRFPRERLLRWLREREQGRPTRSQVRSPRKCAPQEDAPAGGKGQQGRTPMAVDDDAHLAAES